MPLPPAKGRSIGSDSRRLTSPGMPREVSRRHKTGENSRPTNGENSTPAHSNKLRQVRRREGRYLLRTNLTENDPAQLWSYYLQLVAVEEAFKNLKGDLAIRPIFHQHQDRVEAHIFIAFLAYCLHVTLGRRLHALAPGLTPRSVLEKFAAIQMIDVHIPTSDGRELVLTRYTEPQAELKLLLDKLRLELPAQPPPKITAEPPPPQATP